ncbi:hypothetical protein C0Q70_11949 [Pomacea canaliculata]|uniref:Uncharacterized protein n=1 Tax=Pomacea canaliculata TaxID=400727 RepID=A0A2T7P7G8_POMCA|nr:hypothetical protein C0Q70_11949 [Pomacea canaliculata]
MHQQVRAESEKTVNDDLTIGHVCARTADSRGSPSRPAPSCEILRDRADNSVRLMTEAEGTCWAARAPRVRRLLAIEGRREGGAEDGLSLNIT